MTKSATSTSSHEDFKNKALDLCMEVLKFQHNSEYNWNIERGDDHLKITFKQCRICTTLIQIITAAADVCRLCSYVTVQGDGSLAAFIH